MNRYRIAVVVDEKALRDRISHCLEFIGEKAEIVSGSDTCLTGSRVLNERSTIVLTDHLSASEVSSHLPVIHFGKDGGANVVAHLDIPFDIYSVLDALYAARIFIDQQNYDWPAVEKESLLFPRLVGISSEIQRLREQMGKAAPKDVTVLVTGESGTGKEVVARSLHDASRRSSGAFVPVNCGAIPGDLIESELFGHERGAFTGAVSSRAGRFELANGGTIFLDEVGDLPHSMQVKLLRVIQERTFERIGGTETQSTDVRIIAATHRDLEEMIKQGEFREDLYYRLNVFPLRVPALRDHKQDLPVLMNTLLQRIQVHHETNLQFESQAMQALTEYSWPGNVRELANLIERLSVQHPDSVIGLAELPSKFRRSNPGASQQPEKGLAADVKTVVGDETATLLPLNGIDLKEYLTDLEKNLIRQALEDTNSVVARAADRLNIRRTTLVEKMRKYGLSRIELIQGRH